MLRRLARRRSGRRPWARRGVVGYSLGIVQPLFLAEREEGAARYRQLAGAVRLHEAAEPGDEDLLDFAAIHTLLNDGTVYAVEPEKMPDESSWAAVFRY
jgi:hypothetical protein